MTVGHNNPPSELDAQQPNVDAVLEDAEATLTGVIVETAKQDEAVGDLLKRIKAVKKDVNTAHKSDKAHWLEGGKRVDTQKNGMIDDLARAEKTAQECRTPYLQKLEAERAEAARIAREKAEAEQKALEEARDIAEREQAAKDARIKAAQAAKPKATGLKTVWHTSIADLENALNHYYDDPRLAEAVLQMARSDVHGGKREIPGFKITSERTAR